MGRGNLQKRAFQKEGSIKGGSRIDGETQRSLTDFKRQRPTRNQAPSTLPNVDIHGILFPTGPTETVRRGWNRTAGSRYAFAADGVTFESSDGI